MKNKDIHKYYKVKKTGEIGYDIGYNRGKVILIIFSYPVAWGVYPVYVNKEEIEEVKKLPSYLTNLS